MPSAISLCKFTGTISLGLLTGVSYTLSTLHLPLLLTLPSARTATYTLSQSARLSALQIRSLSALSTVSLALAFYLSPTRVRHPYLLWTALVAASCGAVVGYGPDGTVGGGVEEEGEGMVNGEMVEKRARERQVVEGWRAVVSGVGFAMGVVGIWGDGA